MASLNRLGFYYKIHINIGMNFEAEISTKYLFKRKVWNVVVSHGDTGGL